MVGAERRAGLVECEGAQSVAPEEAIVATSPSAPSRSVLPTSPTPPHDSTNRTSASKARRDAGVQRRNPQTARFSGLPRKYPRTGRKHPCLREVDPASWAVFAARSVGEGVRMQILVTGVSGYVGAALAPALAGEGHDVRGFARSPERVAAAGVALDELVTGDALTGAGLERGDGRRRGRLLPDPLDGGRGRRRVPRAGAPRRGALRRRGAGGRRAPDRLPRRARAARGRRLAPPRLAARRRGGAARRPRPSRSRCAPRS